MMVVLIIVGILLMSTLYLSGEQVQKVRNKAVKESITAERQSHYSRNIWSSSRGWILYKYMDININDETNNISFTYEPRSNDNKDDIKLKDEFTNSFIIKNIIINPNQPSNFEEVDNITFRYTPYQISCEQILGGNKINQNNSTLLIAQVNQNKDYCFEINKKNCRLMDVSDSSCEKIKALLQ